MTAPLRILWAAPNTVLDTANGAGIMVRECLKQLALRGCEVRSLGATVFVDPRGRAGRADLWPELESRKGDFVEVEDGPLSHRLLVTQRPQRRLMLSFEEQRWFDEYCRQLDEFVPDAVLFFDNSLLTLLTADEAKRRGVGVGVFLMHPNNSGRRWCRDVDWMFTDTRSTAAMYREREGYDMIPVGTFIDPASVLAERHSRERVLFVNPIPAKGAVLVVQVALYLARHRPDILFEVVDTRGTWRDLLTQVSRAMGTPTEDVPTVRVTPNTRDMRPVYGRARLLLAPSMWWDSGPRVVVEALINGIPVIGSASGGIPEVLGGGGEILKFDRAFQQAPYLQLLPKAVVERVAGRIAALHDDTARYERLVQKARETVIRQHDLQKNGDRLLECFRTCIADRLAASK